MVFMIANYKIDDRITKFEIPDLRWQTKFCEIINFKLIDSYRNYDIGGFLWSLSTNFMAISFSGNFILYYFWVETCRFLKHFFIGCSKIFEDFAKCSINFFQMF